MKIKIRDKTLDKLAQQIAGYKWAANPPPRVIEYRANHIIYFGSIRDKLDATLELINGRADRHVMHGLDIMQLAAGVEQELTDRGVTVKHRAGTIVRYTPAMPDYKGNHKSRLIITTEIQMERTSSGWWLTGAKRAELWAGTKEHRKVNISQAAADDIMKPYSITTTPQTTTCSANAA